MAGVKLRKGSKEEFAFKELLAVIDKKSNVSEYDAIAKGNKEKFNNGYAILKSESLVLRLSGSKYMINPFIIKTTGDDASVKRNWLEVTKKSIYPI